MKYYKCVYECVCHKNFLSGGTVSIKPGMILKLMSDDSESKVVSLLGKIDSKYIWLETKKDTFDECFEEVIDEH